MEKLKQQTEEQLSNKYFDAFGYYAETSNKDKIIASLFYGKRINSLTEEEVNTINEI